MSDFVIISSDQTLYELQTCTEAMPCSLAISMQFFKKKMHDVRVDRMKYSFHLTFLLSYFLFNFIVQNVDLWKKQWRTFDTTSLDHEKEQVTDEPEDKADYKEREDQEHNKILAEEVNLPAVKVINTLVGVAHTGCFWKMLTFIQEFLHKLTYTKIMNTKSKSVNLRNVPRYFNYKMPQTPSQLISSTETRACCLQ